MPVEGKTSGLDGWFGEEGPTKLSEAAVRLRLKSWLVA